MWGGLAAAAILAVGIAVYVFWEPGVAQVVEEGYCAQVWDSFDRTSRLSRELGAALESALTQPVETAAPRMREVRAGLVSEADSLQRLELPPPAQPVQEHALAALAALVVAADPQFVEDAGELRAEWGAQVREQMLTARGEARAAMSALKSADAECANRPARSNWRLLGRQRGGDSGQ